MLCMPQDKCQLKLGCAQPLLIAVDQLQLTVWIKSLVAVYKISQLNNSCQHGHKHSLQWKRLMSRCSGSSLRVDIVTMSSHNNWTAGVSAVYMSKHINQQLWTTRGLRGEANLCVSSPPHTLVIKTTHFAISRPLVKPASQPQRTFHTKPKQPYVPQLSAGETSTIVYGNGCCRMGLHRKQEQVIVGLPIAHAFNIMVSV